MIHLNSFPETQKYLQEKTCPAIRIGLLKQQKQPIPAQLFTAAQADTLVQPLLTQTSHWDHIPFHGYDSLESAIRFLTEKGIPTTHPVFEAILTPLVHDPQKMYSGIGKPGLWMDEAGLGGSRTIRAYCFAKAGREDFPFVLEELPRALQVFASVINRKNFAAVSTPYKDKTIFKAGCPWPSVYHLRLLAWTESWRTAQNEGLLLQAVQKLVDFSPMPYAHHKQKSQLVAPANFTMTDFTPDLDNLSPYGWMMWFHRMELLGRLGLLDKIPALQPQLTWLKNHLNENQGWFSLNLKHSSFKKWGAYTGLQLEADWRTSQRRKNDLTYRALTILNFANKG